jgi:predicted Fe-S protein YdhL (DUF1289 family)
MLQRTPCVGICSTTYGDLVCRGCKRFSHEIVQWNGFAEDQQLLVWQRLFELREGAVLSCLAVHDQALLLETAAQFKVPELESLSIANVAYEVLRQGRSARPLSVLGLSSLHGDESAADLYQRVEKEFFLRSVAQYEHDFHISSQ